MPQLFIIRTVGGPHPGDHLIGEDQFPWPLPEMLMDKGGSYIKIREEFLAIRTAYYVWRTTEQIQEAMNA